MLIRMFQRNLLFVGFDLEPYFNKKEVFFLREAGSIRNLAEGCYRGAGSSNQRLSGNNKKGLMESLSVLVEIRSNVLYNYLFKRKENFNVFI